jgi:hypothetical protein
MTKDDLKQIRELLQDNNKDLRSEFGKLLSDNNADLRKEFSELLQESNKDLKKELTETIVSEIGEIVNTAFSEFEEKTARRFDKIDEDLAQKPSLREINAWADSNLIPFQRDVEKLKYLHIKELKDIPDNLTVSSALIDEGLN